MSNKDSLAQRAVAECLGTAMLLATVVGSGIMAERLASGNVAVALLANTVATGAVLVALIRARFFAIGKIPSKIFAAGVTETNFLQTTSRILCRAALRGEFL